MMNLLYILGQCSWGAVQTLMGLFVFLIYGSCPHHFYRGCIDTRWDRKEGLSLGLFIFTPDSESEWAKEILVHEYGHTFQSLMLGPVYIFVVGLVSVIWKNFPYFKRLREEKKLPYTACFVESWASELGEKITGENALW